MHHSTLLASTAFLLSLSGAAVAQEAAESAPNVDHTELEEIIVTAQFKRENLQKAALAVDVVSGADIANAGVTSPTQLTTIVPALQISQSGAGTQSFFIRGVGVLTANSYTDPGVAFNVDGIYIGRPTSMRNTFFDIERVEVLKGPQGTLYGRNATGGAINVIPVKPRLGEFGGTFGAGYGDYSDLSFDGAVNIPLGENMAVRVAGVLNEHDGYLSDGTNDAESRALRGQFLFDPGDGLSIRISADYAEDRGAGYGSTISSYINPLTGVATISPLYRRVGLADPRSGAIFAGQYSFMSGRFGQGIVDSPFTDNNYWGVTGEVGADLGFGNLTVLVAKRGSNLDMLDFGVGFPAYTDQEDDQFSAEVRLASADEGLLRWLVGAYYYDENISSNYQFNLYAMSSLQELETDTTTSAGFARLTFALTDNLRLVGGMRYTHEEKRFAGQNDAFLDICTAAVPPIPACPTAPFFAFAPTTSELVSNMNLLLVNPGPPSIYIQPTPEAANTIFQLGPIPVSERSTKSRLTFRAAVEYDLGPENLLYASFEDGFKAGGFFFALRSNSYKPEYIEAWTIGSKNRFFDGKLQLNLEAFLWKYRDQQISHFATDTNGALVFITENAGKSTNQGVEISTLFRPLDTTTVRFDVQYLDAKYDTFTYQAPTAPIPLITGCPVTAISATVGQADCSGLRALRSPEWTLNAGIEHVIPFGEYDVTLSADTRWQSDTMVGFEMLPEISEQEDYFTTNASITIAPARGRWSISAYVNNIEDNRPFGQIAFNNQFDTFSGSPLPPRTYGVRGRVTF